MSWLSDSLEIPRAVIIGWGIAYVNAVIQPSTALAWMIAGVAVSFMVYGYLAERRKGWWRECPDCRFRVRSTPPDLADRVYWEHRETAHHHTTE